MSEAQDLSAFFNPRSVAVVGASDNPAKWGYYFAAGALAGAARRDVHFINPRSGPILGHPVHREIREIDQAPELVVVAVPGHSVEDVVATALELGSRAFVVVAADVPDPAGLAARVTAAGGRILGPNCLGVYDAANELRFAAWMDLLPGPLAIVTQSGQIGRDIAALAHPAGLGVSRFVSVGPQLDVTAEEVLESLISDNPTEVVALYLEGFTDGRRLIDVLRRLRECGKPTLVMTVGSSSASQHAALSHTGALTSSIAVVDAACRAAGAVRVSTPSEAVHTARLLLTRRPPAGRRMAIFGDSGGQGALAADIALAAGLQVPEFPPAVAAAIDTTVTALVPHQGGIANPVDLANAGDRDMFIYPNLAAIALENDAADAVVISGYFGQYGADAPELLDTEIAVVGELAAVAARTGKPVIVNTPATGSPALAAMADAGVAVFHTVESALGAIATATNLATASPRELGAAVEPGSRLPPPDGYFAARALAGEFGVPFPVAQRVADDNDLRAAATSLNAPYVLKADWLTHKTEHGGVVIGINDLDALEIAYKEMLDLLGPGAYVVEEMDRRAHVVELIVGIKQDPGFGPVVLVGAGGTHAELYGDVVTELAPVDSATARSMLDRLTCAPLLHGWRGAPGVDLEAATAVIVAVADLAVTRPDITEFELNPLRVSPLGALAVDAIALAPQPTEPSPVTEDAL